MIFDNVYATQIEWDRLREDALTEKKNKLNLSIYPVALQPIVGPGLLHNISPFVAVLQLPAPVGLFTHVL